MRPGYITVYYQLRGHGCFDQVGHKSIRRATLCRSHFFSSADGSLPIASLTGAESSRRNSVNKPPVEYISRAPACPPRDGASLVTRGQPGGLPPCLIYYLRTTPYERLLTTVCLRQPAPLRELSTLNAAAAWRLAQCWRPALVAARVLLVRSPDAQFCLQIPLGKVRAPKNVSAAREGGMAPLGAGDFFEGRRAKKDGWRVQKVRVGALVQQPLSRFAHGSGVASCGPRRARVCGALALTHSHTPSLVAWQEEREVTRRAALTQTAPQ